MLWELQFLKVIGYDLELKSLVDKEIVNGEKIYFVKSNNEKKLIPNFLIDIDDHVYDNKTLLKGLKLVGDYIDKSILVNIPTVLSPLGSYSLIRSSAISASISVRAGITANMIVCLFCI